MFPKGIKMYTSEIILTMLYISRIPYHFPAKTSIKIDKNVNFVKLAILLICCLSKKFVKYFKFEKIMSLYVLFSFFWDIYTP